MLKTFFFILIVFAFSACSSGTNKPRFTEQEYSKMVQRPTIFMDLNSAITELANQILINNVVQQDRKKLAITAFVSLNDFKQTSTFGRVASESMINELHIRNFHVLDFRGQGNISIDKNGEYHISRENEKIKNKIENSYILVGTYSMFDQNSVAINARILNFETGEVISSGRVIFSLTDCKLFDLCEKEDTKMMLIKG